MHIQPLSKQGSFKVDNHSTIFSSLHCLAQGRANLLHSNCAITAVTVAYS